VYSFVEFLNRKPTPAPTGRKVPLPVPRPDPLLLIVAWCWIGLPCIPSTAAWLRLFRPRENGRAASRELKLLLSVTNVSYLWILISLFFREPLLGSDYSSQRYSTIEANFFGMAAVTLWALIRGKRFGCLPFFAALSTTSVWFYLEIVNSVV
jgi:hypothetical protein